MNTRRMRCRRACSHDGERPCLIREERVCVWQAVVEILVLHVCVTDRYGALFAKLEARIRRNVVILRIVVRSDSRAVVLARARAGDVEPVSNNIDWFTEIDSHSCVVRHVETVRDRISAGDPRTKLHDRRRTTRTWGARLKVVAVLVCVLTAVLFPEQSSRVTRRRRACGAF